LLVAATTIHSCTGCPFRKERITIGTDGSVHIVATFEGSAEEMAKFDALPSAETGWTVERTSKEEKKADGKSEQTQILTAEKKFRPGMLLPRTYARPGDANADLTLDFPTGVKLDDRDGTHYLTFRRVYSPRPWAYADYWENVFIDDDIKKLTEKPADQLTADERVKIVQALAQIQAFRQIEFATRALAEAEPGLPVEHRVRARRALLDAYDHEQEHLQTIVERCAQKTEDDRDLCFEAETQGLLSEGMRAFRASLQIDAGMNQSRLVRFDKSYERAKNHYEITNDLGGNIFEIELAIPGELIAHNADEVKEDKTGERVLFWQFNGRAFRDREHEVVAVTRLGPPPRTVAP
jgi:hypothetical protein